MSELLPCPFCGGEAMLLHLDYDDGRVWGVFCGNDIYAEYSHGHFVDNYATDTEAIEAWNTRAERTCQRVVYKPTGVLVCSECGAGIPKQLDKYCYLHYCPNCGAKVVDE